MLVKTVQYVRKVISDVRGNLTKDTRLERLLSRIDNELLEIELGDH